MQFKNIKHKLIEWGFKPHSVDSEGCITMYCNGYRCVLCPDEDNKDDWELILDLDSSSFKGIIPSCLDFSECANTEFTFDKSTPVEELALYINTITDPKTITLLIHAFEKVFIEEYFDELCDKYQYIGRVGIYDDDFITQGYKFIHPIHKKDYAIIYIGLDLFGTNFTVAVGNEFSEFDYFPIKSDKNVIINHIKEKLEKYENTRRKDI